MSNNVVSTRKKKENQKLAKNNSRRYRKYHQGSSALKRDPLLHTTEYRNPHNRIPVSYFLVSSIFMRIFVSVIYSKFFGAVWKALSTAITFINFDYRRLLLLLVAPALSDLKRMLNKRVTFFFLVFTGAHKMARYLLALHVDVVSPTMIYTLSPVYNKIFKINCEVEAVCFFLLSKGFLSLIHKYWITCLPFLRRVEMGPRYGARGRRTRSKINVHFIKSRLK